jgi:hypothetical protein
MVEYFILRWEEENNEFLPTREQSGIRNGPTYAVRVFFTALQIVYYSRKWPSGMRTIDAPPVDDKHLRMTIDRGNQRGDK